MDMEQLVDAVTKMILERLSPEGPKVVAFGEVPRDLLCPAAQIKQGSSCADIAGCDYIVMTAESFYSYHGGQPVEEPQACQPEGEAPCPVPENQTIDLTGKRLIHERDLRDHNAQSGDLVRVDLRAIVTALAHDYAKSVGAKIVKE